VEDLIEQLARAGTDLPIVVHDPEATVADAVRYIRLGAHDVAGAGANLDDVIEHAVEIARGRREVDSQAEPWRKLLVGSSPAMQRTVEVIRLVGGRRSTVLITG